MSTAIKEVAVDTTVDTTVEETVEEVVERPYTLRKFNDGDLFPILKIFKKIGDLFPILKIFKKIGIKDCKEAFVQVASGEKTLKQIGILAAFDLADILIGNLTKVEEEVYSLYSDMSGIAADEIRAMEFGTLPLMIMDSFNEVKNTSFFKVLSKLL